MSDEAEPSDDPEPEGPPGSRTFRHERVTFDVPDDWVDDSIVRLRRGPKGKHPPNLVLSRERVGEDETLADVALRVLKGVRGAVGAISVLDKGAASHPELEEAYRQAYTWAVPDGGPTLVQRAYFVRYRNMALILYGTAREAERDEMEAAARAAFRSLRYQGHEEWALEEEIRLKAKADRLAREEAARAEAEAPGADEADARDFGDEAGGRTLEGLGGRDPKPAVVIEPAPEPSPPSREVPVWGEDTEHDGEPDEP